MVEDNLLDEEQISIMDEEGNETLFDIVLTFELEQFKKSYVVVTPVSEDDEEDDETPLYVFTYTPDETGENGRLDEVENEEEWAACEEVVNTFIEAEELDELEDEEEE